jgi:hypothetical protein
MSRLVTYVVLLGVLAAGACRREQTFDEAMHVLCELPGQLDSGSASDLAREASRRVTNPEVLAWMRASSPLTPAQRDAQVSAMLRRAHITTCWMAPPARCGASPDRVERS